MKTKFSVVKFWWKQRSGLSCYSDNLQYTANICERIANDPQFRPLADEPFTSEDSVRVARIIHDEQLFTPEVHVQREEWETAVNMPDYFEKKGGQCGSSYTMRW